MVKTRIKIKDLNLNKRKGLTQPVSFALVATFLSNCGGGRADVTAGGPDSDIMVNSCDYYPYCIIGTSGNDYLEIDEISFVTGNGGNDTFVFSWGGHNSTITDLSTGDVIIATRSISATNVKNFVANSQTQFGSAYPTTFYSDDSGSVIDVSKTNSDSEGSVEFNLNSGGNGVDTLIGSKTKMNIFHIIEAGSGNSDIMIGGDNIDRIALNEGTHTFSIDSNIKNIENIWLWSATNSSSSVDLSSQTENLNIVGDHGNDTIISGMGNDYIDGRFGNDIITGGAGSDTLTGGPGSDTFIFLKSDGTSGADTITDFTFQEGDKLDLSSFSISTKSKALDNMTDDGSGNTQVTIDGDLIVTLNGISKSDLSGYDFIA